MRRSPLFVGIVLLLLALPTTIGGAGYRDLAQACIETRCDADLTMSEARSLATGALAGGVFLGLVGIVLVAIAFLAPAPARAVSEAEDPSSSS